jgi:hypothetical protein
VPAAHVAREGFAQGLRARRARVAADLGYAFDESLAYLWVGGFAGVACAEIEERLALLFQLGAAFVETDEGVGWRILQHGVQEEAGRGPGRGLFVWDLHGSLLVLRCAGFRHGV